MQKRLQSYAQSFCVCVYTCVCLHKRKYTHPTKITHILAHTIHTNTYIHAPCTYMCMYFYTNDYTCACRHRLRQHILNEFLDGTQDGRGNLSPFGARHDGAV